MKRVYALLFALALSAGLVCPKISNAADQVVIKIAGMKPEGEPETVAMYRFGEILGKLSNGKYKVQVFPNNQLGKEKAYIPNTQKGIVQMCATGTQTSMFHKAMGMLETPMLFDSYEHAHKAMNGKTFELIHKGFPEVSGLRMINSFPLGYRHFYTKKPVKQISDIQGLRMRVPNIPLYTNFAKECGISGQAMASAEVPSALDQGIIDGGDSPISDIVANKMYEKCPEITLTRHILVIHGLYVNEKFYQKLPAQDKAWFDQAAKECAEEVWAGAEAVDAKGIKEMVEHKCNVSEPTEELKKFMKESGERSWSLFTDPKSSQYVPNAQEILDSAKQYK